MWFENQCWSDSFSYKKLGCARHHFRGNKVQKMYHKFLFWKQRSWCKNVNCHFIALIIMKRSLKFTNFYVASFSIRTCFYETSSVFYLKHKTYFHKTISFFWKFSKYKGYVTLNTFGNFAYFSIYLQSANATTLDKTILSNSY